MHDGLLTFIPLAQEHLAMLREWLLRPHVAAWWGEAETVDELPANYVAKAHPSNVRAIRCYEASGFCPVGCVDTPDGEALLMRCAR